MSILSAFSDLLWPRQCAVCGGTADRPSRHVCSDCLERIDFVPTNGCCRKCGRDVVGLAGEFLCQDCRSQRPAFDRVASSMHFEGVARDLVNAFKFRRAFYLRDDLVDFLEATVRARFKVDEIGVVTAMPATAAHRLLRGYNQCELLAAGLSARLGLRYVPSLLKRVGHPRRQGELSERERRENVKGTFAATTRAKQILPMLKGKVFLVDDIMTTGATLSECSRALKASGVACVWCATLAHTVRM